MKQRRQLYTGLIGAVVGTLLTGLVLPWAVGEGEPTTPLGAAALQGGSGLPSGAPEQGASDHRDEVPPLAEAVPTTVASNPDGSASPLPPDSRQPAAPGRPSATDVGVSSTEVVLGALLFDLGGASRAGFVAAGADREQQQRMFEAFVAEANATGGAAGRRIALRFAAFDPLRSETVSAACLRITEDEKAFVVIGTAGFTGEAITCVTQQHRTPVISGQGEAEEIYQRSQGRLVTSRTAANRIGRIMVNRAHAQDRLRGRTIGVVLDDRPPSRLPVEQAVLPQLKELGYQVSHIVRLSEDVQTGQSQIPIAINEMRTKGVDTVIFAASPIYSNLWFNQAEASAYRPKYIVSDLATMATDFAVQSAPPSLDAIGYTSTRTGEAERGVPEQPESASCRATYQRRGGVRVDRGSDAEQIMSSICGHVRLFVTAARAVQGDLTRSNFLHGLLRLPPAPFPDIGGTLSFGTKFDGADFVRTVMFDGRCRCWLPTDDFVRG